jgi:hypothetical protein
MKIIPTANWKLLGTTAELNPQNEYEARWAKNQPGWQDERKIFTDSPEPIGFLLKQGEYVITEADHPADLDRLERLLCQWLETVEIALDHNAMFHLTEQTKRCLADLQQGNKQTES